MKGNELKTTFIAFTDALRVGMNLNSNETQIILAHQSEMNLWTSTRQSVTSSWEMIS